MKPKAPTLNKSFHIVIAITIISIYVLLNWVTDTRKQDFLNHQNEIALKIVSSTAREISTYIENRRSILKALHKSYLKELIALEKEPSNVDIRKHILEKMAVVFPEIIDFTIANNAGTPLLPKISDFVVGNTCRRNISVFSRGHLEAVYIHDNPIAENSHFDILTKLFLSRKESGVLFMSLKTTVIEAILANRAPSDHHFYLIKGSESRFIEVSASGNKNTITRPKRLSVAEQNLISTNIKVLGTSWNLISTVDQKAVISYSEQLNVQKYQILALCLFAGFIVSFLFYRTDKKRLSAEMLTLCQNIILEEKVSKRTKELTYRATHDQLTKLINRSEFERRLKESISLSKADRSSSILMYLDLDQFKIINDTAGHAAGDELLIEISSLLKSQLRKGDTLARLGGDEFGLLLNHCSLERAETIAEQLRVIVHNYEFLWEAYSFTIGVSIGVIVINEETVSLKEILSLVDSACYMAKDQGRNQYYIYNDEDTIFEQKHGAMYQTEMALSAIKNHQLVLHGQKISPLVSDSDEQWYEVLVRIKAGESLIYPDNFIPALEQFGHITTLDNAVLKQSIAFLAKHPHFKLSINLSGLSIVKPEIIEAIQQSIKKHKVDPKKLCFEITESAAIGNLKQVKQFISDIHDIGCSIALDDFGTGMSSFGYLSNLDVDYIKLDGSFVKDIDTNLIHRTMVESINSIVQVMGKFIIAEYVENKAIQEHLKHIGISHGQGYFIHKPEKLDDIANA